MLWRDEREKTIPGGLAPWVFWDAGAGCDAAQGRVWAASVPSPPAPQALSNSCPLKGIIMMTLEIIPLCPSPCIISDKPPRQPARAPQKTVASFEVRVSVLFPERFWFNDRCRPCQKRNFVMESKLSGYKCNPKAELQWRAGPGEQAGLWVEPRWAQSWAQPPPQTVSWG